MRVASVSAAKVMCCTQCSLVVVVVVVVFDDDDHDDDDDDDTFAKEQGYIFTSVCLSVCTLILKNLWTNFDLIKFLESTWSVAEETVN